jgi:hypothetical protein
MQAAFSTPDFRNANARLRGHLVLLAEWTGLAYGSQAAAAPAGAALLAPPKAAQAAFSTPDFRNANARLRGRLGLLAEWTGLEPATPGVTGRYSNQLNYHS